MCYIASVYQEGKKNKQALQKLVEELKEQERINPDGSAIVGMEPENGEIEVIRKHHLANGEIERMLKKYRVVHLHFRKGTSGKVLPINAHFWEIGNWLMAHNGTFVGSVFVDKKVCDSYLFFKTLVKNKWLSKRKIKIMRIKGLIDELAWGRFIFINKKYRKV